MSKTSNIVFGLFDFTSIFPDSPIYLIIYNFVYQPLLASHKYMFFQLSIIEIKLM